MPHCVAIKHLCRRVITNSLSETCLRAAQGLERQSLHSENQGYNVTIGSLSSWDGATHNPMCNKQTIYKCTLYTTPRSRPCKALGPAMGGKGLPGKPTRHKADPRGTGKGPATTSLFTEQPLNQPTRCKAEGETECLPSGHAQHTLPKGRAGGHIQSIEPSKGWLRPPRGGRAYGRPMRQPHPEWSVLGLLVEQAHLTAHKLVGSCPQPSATAWILTAQMPMVGPPEYAECKPSRPWPGIVRTGSAQPPRQR